MVHLLVDLQPAPLPPPVVAKPGRDVVTGIDEFLRFQPQLVERLVEPLPEAPDLVRSPARVRALALGQHPLDLGIKGLNRRIEVTPVVCRDEGSGLSTFSCDMAGQSIPQALRLMAEWTITGLRMRFYSRACLEPSVSVDGDRDDRPVHLLEWHHLRGHQAAPEQRRLLPAAPRRGSKLGHQERRRHGTKARQEPAAREGCHGAGTGAGAVCGPGRQRRHAGRQGLLRLPRSRPDRRRTALQPRGRSAAAGLPAWPVHAHGDVRPERDDSVGRDRLRRCPRLHDAGPFGHGRVRAQPGPRARRPAGSSEC